MPSETGESEALQVARKSVQDAEALPEAERPLKLAVALEDYAVLLRQEKRVLDAVNAEARARKLRADYYEKELEEDTSQDWQVQMAIFDANRESRQNEQESGQGKKSLFQRVFAQDPEEGLLPLAKIEPVRKFMRRHGWRGKAIVIIAFVAGNLLLSFGIEVLFGSSMMTKARGGGTIFEVPAQIIESEASNDAVVQGRPQVNYTFELAGNTYNSSRLSADDDPRLTPSFVVLWVAEHPVGSAVTAYVDSKNPQNSVLLPPRKSGNNPFLSITILAACLLVSTGALLSYLSQRKEKK